MKNIFLKIRNFFLILILIFVLGGLSYRIYEDYKRHQLLKRDLFELLKKKEQLLEEIKNLEIIKSESNLLQRLEKQARLMLGMKKEGEQVILVVPPKEISSLPPISTSTNNEVSSFNFFQGFKNLWYNILKIFKNK